jgi:hypothetical protein
MHEVLTHRCCVMPPPPPPLRLRRALAGDPLHRQVGLWDGHRGAHPQRAWIRHVALLLPPRQREPPRSPRLLSCRPHYSSHAWATSPPVLALAGMIPWSGTFLARLYLCRACSCQEISDHDDDGALSCQDYWTERVRTSDAQHLCPGQDHTLVDLWNDTAPGRGLNNTAEVCGSSPKVMPDPEDNPVIGNCSAATITKGVCLLHATPIFDRLNSTDPGQCCAACKADPRCISWNTNTKFGECYLRSKGHPLGPSDPSCNGMGIMRGEPPPSPPHRDLPYPVGPNGDPNPACT